MKEKPLPVKQGATGDDTSPKVLSEIQYGDGPYQVTIRHLRFRARRSGLFIERFFIYVKDAQEKVIGAGMEHSIDEAVTRAHSILREVRDGRN